MVLGSEAIEVLFVLVLEREARSAFIKPEDCNRVLRCLVAIYEEDLVAFERRDSLFERCDLRVEVLDHRATASLSRVRRRVEKDASQGRRNKGVVFLWDDGHIGRH